MVGPILYFQGLAGGHCQLAVVLVLPDGATPPGLHADGQHVEAERLSRRLGQSVWRYRFRLPARVGGSQYRLDEVAYRVHPPVPGERLRIAFTACNGRETDQPGDDDPVRNANWRQLLAEHREAPFNLLLQGGDQLYADGVWAAVSVLQRWRAAGAPARIRPDRATLEAIRDHYFRLYCWLWGQADLAPVLARIPSLMMWDDHDLVDGWGSHLPGLQLAPMFQAVGQAAREHFALFQQAMGLDELPAGFGGEAPGHFGRSHRLGSVGLVVPDLRSQRTPEQVMNEHGWAWLGEQLTGMADCKQLLLLSTVPLLNIDLSALERALVAIPGEQLYQDDLRDQWRSYAHREEWCRLSRWLLALADSGATGVTVLSGEIHLGAWGVLERHGAMIQQFTASGMVHPPPPRTLARYYDWLGRRQQSPLADSRLRMLPLPVYGRRYLCERNWLALDCRTDGSLRANWRGTTLPPGMTVETAAPEKP